jgi:hypothetical protein
VWAYLFLLAGLRRSHVFKDIFAQAVFPEGVPKGTANHVIQFELGFPTKPMPPTMNSKLISLTYALKYEGNVSMACAAGATLPLLVGFAPFPPASPVQNAFYQAPIGQMPIGQMPMGQILQGQGAMLVPDYSTSAGPPAYSLTEDAIMATSKSMRGH